MKRDDDGNDALDSVGALTKVRHMVGVAKAWEDGVSLCSCEDEGVCIPSGSRRPTREHGGSIGLARALQN